MNTQANLRTTFHGWRIVLVSGIILALAISPIFQGLGVFFVALRSQFSWSQAAVSGAFSLARAEDSVLGPIVGLLTDKFGSRLMVLIGFMILGCGYLLFASVQNIGMFYFAFFVLAIGSAFAGFLPIMGILNNWFIRRRATAMGISQSGINLGGTMVVPVLAWGIAVVDWKATCLALAMIMFIVAWPLSRMIHDRPEDVGQVADGLPSGRIGPETLVSYQRTIARDFTLREALRTKAFWLISMGHALAANVFVTMTIYTIAMVMEKGIPINQATGVVMVFSITAGLAQFSGGILGDRLPKRTAISGLILLQSLGVLVAVFSQSFFGLVVFGLIFGIGAGARVPLLIAIRGDYFGRRHFATIMGFSQIPITILLIAGPVSVGFIATLLGSYTVPISGIAIAGMFGAVLIGFAGDPQMGRNRSSTIDSKV